MNNLGIQADKKDHFLMIKTQIIKEPRRYPNIIYGDLPSDLLPVWVLEAPQIAAKYLSLSTIKLNEVKIGQGKGPIKDFIYSY